MCLVNITSYLPNVTVALSIDSATSADTGYYYCMTDPPDTISPNVLIEVAGKLHRDTTALFILRSGLIHSLVI